MSWQRPAWWSGSVLKFKVPWEAEVLSDMDKVAKYSKPVTACSLAAAQSLQRFLSVRYTAQQL